MLKSAYEIAMEKSGGKTARELTAAQKKAIAEVNSKHDAAIAELEILKAPVLAAARASGDEESYRAVMEDMAREKASINERREREKKKIREG